ncbi:MAG: CBS domain-containing protein [Actinobacteria bacterium]|nr:CBS domain-containing protein [Actinomycetota bacterium]
MPGSVVPEALEDVVRLLAACPAFTAVADADLVELARDARIAYVAEGDAVRAEDAAHPLVVQRGALLVTDAEGRRTDLASAGEYVAPGPGRLQAVEAALLVLLPESATDLAWSASPEQLRLAGASRDVSGAARDVSGAARDVSGAAADLRAGDPGRVSVGAIMRGPLLTVDERSTCRQAAAQMRDHGVSALVVTPGDPDHAAGGSGLGIVTDRDLRMRLVAEGLSPDTPVAAITTRPVRTVDTATPVSDALLTMLEAGVHHLPVVEAEHGGEALVGMLSAGDMLRARTADPLHLRTALGEAPTVEALARTLGSLPSTVRFMLDAGTHAELVCRVLSAVADRVVQRALQLVEPDVAARHGPRPGPYGFLVFGSQARRERTLGGDQDTGLLVPAGLDAPGLAWFEALGTAVTAALAECGYPRCDGGVMAERTEWRHDADGWRRRFGDWVRAPEPEALLKSAIAFDVRTAAGPGNDGRRPAVEPHLRPVRARAADSGIFLAHVAGQAVRHRPPLGFLGRLVVARGGEHSGAFNVKTGALLPITDLARLFALTRGGDEMGTHERLTAAGADGVVSADLVATLGEGHELGVRVRLLSQAGHLGRAGASGDRDDGDGDWIDPTTLSPLVRSQLREVFKAVRAAQEWVAQRYHTERLG